MSHVDKMFLNPKDNGNGNSDKHVEVEISRDITNETHNIDGKISDQTNTQRDYGVDVNTSIQLVKGREWNVMTYEMFTQALTTTAISARTLMSETAMIALTQTWMRGESHAATSAATRTLPSRERTPSAFPVINALMLMTAPSKT